uniref:Uncharacterized protein n=1 Tax=Lactuca sativa TaxID=4236 RepID=A0A9R1WWL7_LACSA|nr:hypothetical protein LSAT_V11C800440270 [Lactuca sativa]
MDTNRLRFRPFSVDMYEVIRTCRKLNNPHILYNDRMDEIFVLGMLLMAEGNERKQEALIMFNNAYIVQEEVDYEINLLRGSKPLG